MGHNLPTDAINAALVVRLVLIDGRGGVVESKESVIGGWGKNPIPPGGESYLDFEMTMPQGEGYTLEVTLNHIDRERGRDESVTIYRERIGIPAGQGLPNG